MSLRKLACITGAIFIIIVSPLSVMRGPAADQTSQLSKAPASLKAKAKEQPAKVWPGVNVREGRPEQHSLWLDEPRQTLAEALKTYATALAVVANNIANAETAGYKTSHVVLEDTTYRHKVTAGFQDSAGQYSPASCSIGTGSRVSAIQLDFTQGRLKHTGNQLDVAIDGIGFFQVTDPSGTTLYCRSGHLTRNCNGILAVTSAQSCRLLEPAITVPSDALAVSVGPEGSVSVRQPGSNLKSEIGQIELASFTNPEGLRREGENLFAETNGSGVPQVGNPGQGHLGKLRQGWIESSNVDLSEEVHQWNRLLRLCRQIRILLDEE